MSKIVSVPQQDARVASARSSFVAERVIEIRQGPESAQPAAFQATPMGQDCLSCQLLETEAPLLSEGVWMVGVIKLPDFACNEMRNDHSPSRS